jgi:hypothetical protein
MIKPIRIRIQPITMAALAIFAALPAIAETPARTIRRADLRVRDPWILP